MTLEEIQDLINSNQIDLRKLDSDRLSILDGLQKKENFKQDLLWMFLMIKKR